MKRVVIIIREAPLVTVRTSEALRIAVGMTLADHQVQVLYLGQGAYAALDIKPEAVAQPEVKQSLELFPGMKVRECVEREALPPWATQRVRKGCEVTDRVIIMETIRQADVVIPF